MRWTVVVASLWLLGAPVAPAPVPPPSNPKDDFLRWANELARAKKMSVCRAGQLRYPGESAGYFAILGKAEPDNQPDAFWVFAHGKDRWSFNQTGSAMVVETCPTPAPWLQQESVLVGSVGIGARYIWDHYTVTFVEGEPVVLDEEHYDVDGGTTTDWLQPTAHTHHHDAAEPEPTGESDTGSLIALPSGSRWLTSWKTPTFVPFGAKNRQDATDANLAAYVVDKAKAGVQIVVDVTDDRVVPTAPAAPARKFLRGDHLEIWWRPDGTSANKQLGIGVLADGTADVRWLLPSGSPEKTPAVRRAGTHFEIDLPLATLGFDGSSSFPEGDKSLPLAVAFSDADDPAGGQQTVVATSPVRWNRHETFGKLRWFLNKAGRFPSFGTRLPPPSSGAAPAPTGR